MAQQQQLPCDSQGVCMACKAQPADEEKLSCVTCVTPWHVACLSSALPPTLAGTSHWVCPDCSNIGTSSDPVPRAPREDGDGELVAKMLAVEADTSLTLEEKARKRQELMTGKSAAEEEENDDKKNKNDVSVSDILMRTLNCCICIQVPERPVTTPCGHTFCLKCFEKWIRQGKRTCAKCRQNIPAKVATQPRINSALVFAIRMARANKNNSNSGGPSRVYHFVHNQDRPDQPYTTDKAQKKGLANACSGKIFVTVPSDHFGPIPPENDPLRNQGLLVGESWASRQECRQWGAHFVHVGGIAGQSDHGAQSVVLSGGYVDDEDHGEWFLYTGSGGKDLSGNKRTNKNHSFDQKFESYNRALQVSCLQGYPVRVVRSHKEKRSSYAPESGVRYDGIYRIEKCWQVAGKQGFQICRYLFVRCDNEPAPWTSDDHGDRPRPLPVVRELKKATTIFERTETPAWDFVEQDACWKWMKPPPPSKKKVQTGEPIEIAKSTTETRKFQNMSIKEKLRRGFSCLICREIMISPVTTPCGHNFCKACLEGAFAGQAHVIERSKGGRTLRSQKNVMKCPTCPIDIAEYLQNLQVDIDLKCAIESLKAKAEENGESLESSENADGLQKDCAIKDDDTSSESKTSVKELNGSPVWSDEGELKVTNKVLGPTVKHNAKRKKVDSKEQLPETGDGRIAARGRKAKKEVNGGNDSPSSPLNLPSDHD